jgi:hypothetical protein
MFEVGTRVRIRESSKYWRENSVTNPRYVEGTITHTGSWIHVEWDNGEANSYQPRDLLVVGNSTTNKPRQKKLYRLVKESLGLKKGTVVREMCNDGTQDFEVINGVGDVDRSVAEYDVLKRSLVVDNPSWFEEVKIEFTPVGKTSQTTTKKRGGAAWTAKQKAAHGRVMKEYWRKKKAGEL